MWGVGAGGPRNSPLQAGSVDGSNVTRRTRNKVG